MPNSSGETNSDLILDPNILLEAAKKISENPEIWVTLASLLYKAFAQRSPYKDEELAKYVNMCHAYKSHTQNPIIPIHWELDKENRPKYSSAFTTQKAEIDAMLGSFKQCDHNMKTLIVGIVSRISRLFESIAKRTSVKPMRNAYRPDGLESMFYNDLAMWLVVDLPRYTITEKKAATLVRARIEYCEYMQKEIFLFHNDFDIANPKDELGDIILELEVLHEHLSQAHQTADFREKALALDRQMMDKIRDTFNILHLMLKDVNQHEFQVRQFLEPTDGHKVKIEILRTSLLGQWLEQTCTVAGIKSNDYQHTKNISIGTINNHISHDASTIKDVADIGLEDFVWKTSDALFSGPSKAEQKKIYLRDKAPSFLNLIINLHRALLRLCYIREGLKLATQLQIAYGESWLFGMPEGKTMFNSLMDMITDANQRHMLALNEVWDAFFTQIYQPYAQKKHKDVSDKVYSDMNVASKFHVSSKKIHTKIVKGLEALTNYANGAQNGVDSHKGKKHALSILLLNYLSSTKGYDAQKIRSLHSIMKSTSASTPGLGSGLSLDSGSGSGLSLDSGSGSGLSLDSGSGPSPEFIQINTKIAIQRLMNEGGYTIEQIPDDLYQAYYDYLTFNPDNSMSDESERIMENFKRAVDEAKKHKSSSSTDLFKKDSMQIALQLKELFNIPLIEHTKDFVSVSTIIQPERLKSWHLQIYQDLLEPYTAVAKYSFVSFFHGYFTEETRNLLRQHHSRMTRALSIIISPEDLYTENNQAHLSVINSYLMRGLYEMFLDMPWLKFKNFTQLLKDKAISSQGDLMLEPEGNVRVASIETVKTMAAKAIAKAENDATASKAETVKVTGERDGLRVERDGLKVEKDEITVEAQALKKNLIAANKCIQKTEKQMQILREQLNAFSNDKKATPSASFGISPAGYSFFDSSSTPAKGSEDVSESHLNAEFSN